MDSALAGYRSSDEETGPLGEIITGESILLPPGVGLLGRRPGLPDLLRFKRRGPDRQRCPCCLFSPGTSASRRTAWSDPADEQAVRQLIDAEISQTQAAESLERALMAREDPVRVALEVIQAERRAVREPVAPSTRTKVIPAVKPMPRVGGHATHSRPGLAYLSKRCSAWLQLRQRPITCFVDSNSHAYALGPCSCPSTCCGSCCHACPWPWKTFDRLFPVPGQGTPCSHDATDHLECAFPAAPAYARASAQVVVFSHHLRPTSPRSSQALICPRLSDQKAREHLSLPFLSGSFISFSFMRLHLICSIQSASISHTCQPAQVEIPCSGLSFALPVFLHPSLSS